MPSTVIASFSYDPERAAMKIVFVSGITYEYKNVPGEVYEQMRTSKAKGIFFNQQIKDRYAFEKINN